VSGAPGPGWLPGAGLSVRTALTNPSTRPGLRLPGRITLAAEVAVPVDLIRLGLVTRVEPADGAREYDLVEFHRSVVAGRLLVVPGPGRAVDFAYPVPWETPITVINGDCLLNLRMGLRTEVAIDPQVDRGGLATVHVHPLPVQAGILAAFTELGFTLRQVGLQAGRLPGVAQRLPFHQKIAFWAAPLYRGPFAELELTFLTDRYGVEVIFALDRRMALAGAGHLSFSRFRVAHTDAGADWPAVLHRWVQHAVARHGYTAARLAR
jgi:sporulation-control protein